MAAGDDDGGDDDDNDGDDDRRQICLKEAAWRSWMKMMVIDKNIALISETDIYRRCQRLVSCQSRWFTRSETMVIMTRRKILAYDKRVPLLWS